MNVPLELIKRTKSASDTEDLAFTFMEEEVGRFDWKNNWPKIKAQGNARQKVQDWLTALHVEHDPDAIVEFLDGMVAGRSGRWL